MTMFEFDRTVIREMPAKSNMSLEQVAEEPLLDGIQ
jgi:hypothetical protein